MVDHRVHAGDSFLLTAFGSVATQIRARVLVEFDNGRLREFNTKLSSTANRQPSEGKIPGIMEAHGRVLRATVARISPVAKRGQVYCVLGVRDRNEVTVDTLARDYLYETNNPTFPNLVPPGPGGGNGFKENRAIADDIAPTDIQETLAVTNALRRIDGFIWYYHCSSDAGNRNLRASLRDPGDGLPTGMTSGANTTFGIWPSAGVITLTQDQEGAMYVNAAEGKIGFAVSIDNGTPTWEDPTANPDPFPYWAQEDDVGELFFDVTTPNANDRHSIYIIEEEWIHV